MVKKTKRNGRGHKKRGGDIVNALNQQGLQLRNELALRYSAIQSYGYNVDEKTVTRSLLPKPLHDYFQVDASTIFVRTVTQSDGGNSILHALLQALSSSYRSKSSSAKTQLAAQYRNEIANLFQPSDYAILKSIYKYEPETAFEGQTYEQYQNHLHTPSQSLSFAFLSYLSRVLQINILLYTLNDISEEIHPRCIPGLPISVELDTVLLYQVIGSSHCESICKLNLSQLQYELTGDNYVIAKNTSFNHKVLTDYINQGCKNYGNIQGITKCQQSNSPTDYGYCNPSNPSVVQEAKTGHCCSSGYSKLQHVSNQDRELRNMASRFRQGNSTPSSSSSSSYSHSSYSQSSQPSRYASSQITSTSSSSSKSITENTFLEQFSRLSSSNQTEFKQQLAEHLTNVKHNYERFNAWLRSYPGSRSGGEHGEVVDLNLFGLLTLPVIKYTTVQLQDGQSEPIYKLYELRDQNSSGNGMGNELGYVIYDNVHSTTYFVLYIETSQTVFKSLFKQR